MTEFELLIAFQGTGETYVAIVSVFLSVLFAYIVTAYLVAQNSPPGGRSQRGLTIRNQPSGV